jgi:hypothetical protein
LGLPVKSRKYFFFLLPSSLFIFQLLLPKTNANCRSAIALSLASFLLLLLPSVLSTSAACPSDDNSSEEDEQKTVYAVGEFLNSELPKPDQIFKFHYRVINGTTESLDIGEQIVDDIFMDNGITVKVNNNDGNNSSNGVLEIKYPRNFPYDSSIRSGDAGLLSFSLWDKDGRGIEGDDRMATECFFVFSIPFTGSSIETEIGTASILIKSCIKVTTFQIAAYVKRWLKMYLQEKMMARLIDYTAVSI